MRVLPKLFQSEPSSFKAVVILHAASDPRILALAIVKQRGNEDADTLAHRSASTTVANPENTIDAQVFSPALAMPVDVPARAFAA
jgi:hypothetical protein